MDPRRNSILPTSSCEFSVLRATHASFVDASFWCDFLDDTPTLKTCIKYSYSHRKTCICEFARTQYYSTTLTSSWQLNIEPRH